MTGYNAKKESEMKSLFKEIAHETLLCVGIVVVSIVFLLFMCWK